MGRMVGQRCVARREKEIVNRVKIKSRGDRQYQVQPNAALRFNITRAR